METNTDILNNSFKNKQPEEILNYFISENKTDEIILGSSMGSEDQVLTDMIVKLDKKIEIFTLDTGRLFPETYQLIEETNQRYGISIRIMFPDREKVEQMVQEKGINLFYRSVENRKECCYIRKVIPAQRALARKKVWITGIRKDQTVSRFFNKHVEWDDSYNLIKINPLLNWTEKQVWDYIKENNVPYNELHDKGFPSIGCQPCTRAVKNNEDSRSGRWWWENTGPKECGLQHNAIKY